jgi:hypothetical protein
VKHLPIGKRIGLVFLYHGGQAPDVALEGLRVAPVRRWSSDAVDWEELRKLLLGIEKP